jgi:hypothetical protein
VRPARPAPELKCPLCLLPIGVGDEVVRLLFGRFAIPPNRLLLDAGMTVRVRRNYHRPCAEAAGITLEDLP